MPDGLLLILFLGALFYGGWALARYLRYRD